MWVFGQSNAGTGSNTVSTEQHKDDRKAVEEFKKVLQRIPHSYLKFSSISSGSNGSGRNSSSGNVGDPQIVGMTNLPVRGWARTPREI